MIRTRPETTSAQASYCGPRLAGKPARRWHTMLGDAILDQAVVNVGETVTRFLGALPLPRCVLTATSREADYGCTSS